MSDETEPTESVPLDVPPPDPEKLVGRERHLFFLILAGGILARFLMLGHASFTIDEINVVQFALAQETYSGVFSTELERFQVLHRLPLLMLILHFVIKTYGTVGAFPSEFLARLPFALMGCLTLPCTYFLGKIIGGKKVGLWSMFLISVSIFHIFYVREAYDYGMVMFFSSAVVWLVFRMVTLSRSGQVMPVPLVAGYVVATTGLLYSHLSGLLFLAGLLVLVFGFVFLKRLAGEHAATGNRALIWLVALGLPFLFFAPFLLKLLAGGFTATEMPDAKRFSMGVFTSLFGRMGWGEKVYALVPFVAIVGVGIRQLYLRAKQQGDVLARICLITPLLYFAVQTWTLRVSRFETRYYSALFPILMVITAVGMVYLVDHLVSRVKPLKNLSIKVRHGVLAVVLLLWLAPSLQAVVAIQSRTGNFKGIRDWVMKELPENGIYYYWNGYDIRAVPTVYPTPGRHVSYPMTWSTTDDYNNYQVADRVTSFFMRFPLAHYILPEPIEELHFPDSAKRYAPRGQLFAHEQWLEDPYFRRLVRLSTFPPGEAQLASSDVDRVLVCYNKPEDLPALTARRGLTLYHYFGQNWAHHKDQQMNDWKVADQFGKLYLGNITGEPMAAQLRVNAVAVPGGGRCNLYDNRGAKVAEGLNVSQFGTELVITNLVLQPGVHEYSMEILPPTNALNAQLAVAALRVEEAPKVVEPEAPVLETETGPVEAKPLPLNMEPLPTETKPVPAETETP